MYSIVDPIFIEDRIDAGYYKQEYIQFDRDLNEYTGICLNLTDLTNDIWYSAAKWHINTDQYSDNGTVILRIKDLRPYWLNIIEPIRVPNSIAHAWKKTEIKSQDIIISITANVGLISHIPENLCETLNLNQALALIRFSDDVKKRIDTRYIATYMMSKYGNIYFNRVGGGRAVQKGLGLEQIKSLKVPIPKYAVQAFIAKKVILAETLREQIIKGWESCKIALSNQMGEESNIISKDNKFSALLVKPELIDDYLGANYYGRRRTMAREKIKTIAKYDSLNQLCKVSNVKINSDAALSNSYKFIGLKNICPIYGFLEMEVNHEERPIGLVQIFENNSIIFSKLRPNLNKIGLILEREKLCGSTELINILPLNIPLGYLYFILKNKWTYEQIVDTTGGSALPRLSMETIESILIPIIKDEIIDFIHNSVIEIFHKHRLLESLLAWAKRDIEFLIKGNLDIDAIERIYNHNNGEFPEEFLLADTPLKN